jgi:hypothetical protein
MSLLSEKPSEKPPHKHWPYTLMYLDHHKIRQSGQTRLNNGQALAEVYHGLLSNLPRCDRSLLAIFSYQPPGIPDTAQDDEALTQAHTLERNQRKVAASTLLMDNGYYTVAAKVDADCGWQAILKTLSINHHWFYPLNASKAVEAHQHLNRSTEIYDVIDYFGTRYLFMPLGFLNLETSAYEKDLV